MKRISQTLVAAVGLALAGSAFARYEQDPYYYDNARVVRVDRIIAQETQPVTREECWQEPVEQPDQIVERTHVTNDGVVRKDVLRVDQPAYQRKCRQTTAMTDTPQVVGYDVVYNYRNEDFHDRMNHDPGPQVRVRVQNGYVQVVDE
jgi:uncharacterized protein YcfJ